MISSKTKQFLNDFINSFTEDILREAEKKMTAKNAVIQSADDVAKQVQAFIQDLKANRDKCRADE